MPNTRIKPAGQKDRIKKEGKQRLKIVKGRDRHFNIDGGDPDPMSLFKIHKGVEDDKKIRPKDVFDGYSDPKVSKGKKSNGKSGPFSKK
mgnify:FL=1|tara:strand:+ start:1668 stop:1934 length:267 start_codon:yes stop_codon:yes gene_type:complete